MIQKYRDNGAKGAILDEYEHAINNLKRIIQDVPDIDLTEIVDSETNDPDCRSIQTILTHVVRSGYGYANAIRKHQGEHVNQVNSDPKESAAKYIEALDHMFLHNVKLFEDYPNLKLGELDNTQKMLTSWGQSYDPEQLLEHAIVHILRHRRQIERFKLKIRENEK